MKNILLTLFFLLLMSMMGCSNQPDHTGTVEAFVIERGIFYCKTNKGLKYITDRWSYVNNTIQHRYVIGCHNDAKFLFGHTEPYRDFRKKTNDF